MIKLQSLSTANLEMEDHVMTHSKIALKLPNQYNPLEDSVYMSPNMLLYFKQKLESMRCNQSIIEELHYNNLLHHAYEYLLRKEIDSALVRIEQGTYGYCEKTGQPMGVEYLMGSPEAKYSLDTQYSF